MGSKTVAISGTGTDYTDVTPVFCWVLVAHFALCKPFVHCVSQRLLFTLGLSFSIDLWLLIKSLYLLTLFINNKERNTNMKTNLYKSYVIWILYIYIYICTLVYK